MTFCAALVYGENAMGLLVCLLVVHFFSAIITIVVLWEISSTQYVLVKIEPETDIISKSEQLKNDVYCMPAEWPWSLSLLLLGLICNLSFLGGGVCFIGGSFYMCFSYKVRKLYPDDFVRFVYVNLPGECRSKDDVCCSSNNGFNPATGLPMLNGPIDAGNAWGSDDNRWDDRW